MTEDIKIYELKRMNLKNAIVIDGFPSVGLVSSITANYLVNVLNLEQIGILDSVYFPTISLIRHAEPLNTVRIYAGERVGADKGGEGEQVVVFISEFQPPQNLIKMIASTILDWIQEQKCSLLISPEGLVVDRTGEETEKDEKEISTSTSVDIERIEAYGVGSTGRAREVLRKNDIKIFQEGVITGVAGVLLNEGRRRDFDVISLLAEAHPNYPDARAAAKVIEAISKFFLHIKLDPKPLYQEAEAIEAQIRTIQKQAKSPKQIPLPRMYG